jgi:hypothetical protein
VCVYFPVSSIDHNHISLGHFSADALARLYITSLQEEGGKGVVQARAFRLTVGVNNEGVNASSMQVFQE